MLTVFRISLLIILVSSALLSQMNQNQPFPIKYSENEKLMLYDINKKHDVAAILLSLTFPGAGHVYTGNWNKAINFLLFKSALIGGTIYSVGETGDPTYLYVGYSSLLIVYVWELIDATDEVSRYNENIFTKITGKPIALNLIQKNRTLALDFALTF